MLSVDQARDVLDYFNGFHDGFMKRIAIVLGLAIVLLLVAAAVGGVWLKGRLNGSLAVLEMLSETTALRDRLDDNTARFRRGIADAGFEIEIRSTPAMFPLPALAQQSGIGNSVTTPRRAMPSPLSNSTSVPGSRKSPSSIANATLASKRGE